MHVTQFSSKWGLVLYCTDPFIYIFGTWILFGKCTRKFCMLESISMCLPHSPTLTIVWEIYWSRLDVNIEAFVCAFFFSLFSSNCILWKLWYKREWNNWSYCYLKFVCVCVCVCALVLTDIWGQFCDFNRISADTRGVGTSAVVRPMPINVLSIFKHIYSQCNFLNLPPNSS